MVIIDKLLGKLLDRVFGAKKEKSAPIVSELQTAVQAIAKIGARRVKEIILALPIFVRFVGELFRNRAQLQAKKQLFVVGAAAALSTLGLTTLATVLGSLPFQFVLLFSHPWLAVALFTAGGLTISCVIVVLVWLIIYALSFVLDDDPTFQRIRDEVLSPGAKEMLADVQTTIEREGGDIAALGEFARVQLEEKGASADPLKVEKDLERLESRVKRAGRSRRARKAGTTG